MKQSPSPTLAAPIIALSALVRLVELAEQLEREQTQAEPEKANAIPKREPTPKGGRFDG